MSIRLGTSKFVFYDFETTGTNPAFDQPLQFAAILTDDDLQPQDRIDIRCRLSPHILPAPWALAVTGVTPDQLMDETLPTQFEFVQELSEMIKAWGPATWVGYNTIAFDEEFLRQAFYQNLHPKIYRTQMNGNDRMDVMKIVYAVWELAHDILEWPQNDSGQPVFKLDQLAPANGFENHDAHDALGDVEATIHIAKLIRDRAPKVWKQALRNRSKHEVNDLFSSGQPLRLIERFGAAPPRSYIGAFAGRNSQNSNAVGFLDLEVVDPEPLAAADDETIAKAVTATPKSIRSVSINKYPALFEVSEPTEETAKRAEALAGLTELHSRVGEALAARFADAEEPEQVEEQIYGQFISDADADVLERFQLGSWKERLELVGQLEDPRLRTLGQRLIYAYAPELLSEKVQGSFSAAIHARWHAEEASWMTFAEVDKQLEEVAQAEKLTGEQLDALREFYDGLR